MELNILAAMATGTIYILWFFLGGNLLRRRNGNRNGGGSGTCGSKTFWTNLGAEDLIGIKPEFPVQGISIPTTN